jgi:hypothetical protein
MPVFLQVASAGGAESIVLSADGVERMMLPAFAESMILSAPVVTPVFVPASIFHCSF